MKASGNVRYRVIATIRGRRETFLVDAASGGKASAKARQIARERGMGRIMVNSVTRLDEVEFNYEPSYTCPVNAPNGTCDVQLAGIYAGWDRTAGNISKLTLDAINSRIAGVWERLVCFAPTPDTSPLLAYQVDGRVYLDDGTSGRQELYERTAVELALLVYEWMLYAGYYCGDFEDFIEESWAG